VEVGFSWSIVARSTNCCEKSIDCVEQSRKSDLQGKPRKSIKIWGHSFADAFDVVNAKRIEIKSMN
jgi:hypothetical protein